MDERFLVVPYSILNDEKLNVSEKIILSFFMKFKGTEYGYCFMSNESIAEELHISLSTTKRSVKKLKDMNYIKIGGTTAKRQVFFNPKEGQNEPAKVSKWTNVEGQNEPRAGSKWTSEGVKMNLEQGQNEPHNIEYNIEHNIELKENKKIYKKSPLVIFNDVFDTNYRNATKETIKIGTDFTEEEIYLVCQKARDDNFWRDKATPYNIFKLSNFEKLLNTEKEKTTKDIANQIDIFEGW